MTGCKHPKLSPRWWAGKDPDKDPPDFYRCTRCNTVVHQDNNNKSKGLRGCQVKKES